MKLALVILLAILSPAFTGCGYIRIMSPYDTQIEIVDIEPCLSQEYDFDLKPIEAEAFAPIVLSDPRIQAAHDISIGESGIAATVSKGRNTHGSVINGLGTLAIIDVSDAQNPEILSYVEGFDDAQTVEVYGDIVHIGDSRGIHVYSIANPYQPKLVDFEDMTRIGRILEINGWKSYDGKKFMASKQGLIIVLDESDISNPYLPKNSWSNKVGGSPHDIDIVDGTLLIASRPRPDWMKGDRGAFNVEAFQVFDESGAFIPPPAWSRIGGLRSNDHQGKLTEANRLRSVNCRTYVSTSNSAMLEPSGKPSFFRVIQNHSYHDMQLISTVEYQPEYSYFAESKASNGLAIEFPFALVAAGQGVMLLDISKSDPVVLNTWYDFDGSLTGNMIPRAASVSGHDAAFYGDHVWVTFEANHAILGFPIPAVLP